MSSFDVFRITQEESLGAMKKTKLTRSLLAACSIVALSAVMYGCVHNGGDGDGMMAGGGMDMSDPDPMAPVDVMMYVTLGADEQAALKAEGVLPDSGDSDTLTVAAGGTARRAGVVFTCDSAYPCTFTLDNNLGTIVAKVSTQMLPDADDPTVTAMIPPPMDPLHSRYTLNPSNATKVGEIIGVAIGTAASDPAPEGARDNSSTTIGGLDLDGFGVYDMSKTTLTSDLDPNVADHMPAIGVTDAMGGATLEVPRDVQTLHADLTALAGWDDSMVLFADWGDSKTPERDGGYETAALLYSNHEEPTTHAFDDKLAAKVANVPVWFTFVAADAAVDFDGDPDTDAVRVVVVEAGANGAPQRARMKITVEGSQISTLATPLAQNSRHKGTYFGAPVTLKCTDAACAVSRATTGEEAFAVTAGAWQILPDPGAMIKIPDQDYMVFGAWLTVPDDNVNGEHRMGVFYDGMRDHGDVAGALTGKAKYEGGAAGVYRDRTASGMFTARAVLEVDFGDDSAAGTLSGRIDDFRNSAGVFLGTDTLADPNDPVSGGENDWVVILESDTIDSDGVTAEGMTAGSADGVEWTGGEWAAKFYGSSGTADDPTAPSGVAGQFRAESGAVAATDDDPATPPTRAVVGAFGAEMMMDDDS